MVLVYLLKYFLLNVFATYIGLNKYKDLQIFDLWQNIFLLTSPINQDVCVKYNTNSNTFTWQITD